jgi:hypothetical protein
MNNNSMAADAARKAIEQSDAIKGKAYLLLGHIWAMAKTTGDTEIDARANFWVAVIILQEPKRPILRWQKIVQTGKYLPSVFPYYRRSFHARSFRRSQLYGYCTGHVGHYYGQN